MSRPSFAADQREWLEADGLGGFASGTVSGVRTRRYHALLLASTTPPTGRYVLVNGLETYIRTATGEFALSAHRYAGGVCYPDGAARITEFLWNPWPRWLFELPDGTRIVQEVIVRRGTPRTFISWRVVTSPGGSCVLRTRPLLSGRDYHALHAENPAFNFDADRREEASAARIQWRPYPGVPDIEAQSNGRYSHAPLWYRKFEYSEEIARGFVGREDLASPGEFEFDLSAQPATLILSAQGVPGSPPRTSTDAAKEAESARRAEEARRSKFASALERAADAYVVQRGEGRTIVAGYPWFADWGRDTFIAMRGLCLATGRFEDARRILLQWAGAVSEGMLPNRFPDTGDEAEYNSVDAALWYIIVVHEFLQSAERRALHLDPAEEVTLRTAVDRIVSGYAAGTRCGIRLNADGLLACGEPGVQLTWMDAKIGDWVVTPRIGKPVEVQALWCNALWIAGMRDRRWNEVLECALASFKAKFWLPDAGHLCDVVDVDRRPGMHDRTFRPNQILAVGGLPLALIDGDMARRVVEQVERRLLTPLGTRSLAPEEPGYTARYEGGPRERDSVYHQGTVWPWLLGPFVEAWLRVNGGHAAREAWARFVEPVMAHLGEAGLGHVSEIADAESPHTPRGCPFQAWSLGELLRIRTLMPSAPPPGESPRDEVSARGTPRPRMVV